MSTVTEIIEAVKQLGEDEKGEFLDRLLELDLEDDWCRQIKADAKAGKLDALWEDAQKEIAEGRTRPLDEVFKDD